MSFKEQDKIALSDEDMGQVIGGFSLNYLIGGSGSGATGVTLEQTVIPAEPGNMRRSIVTALAPLPEPPIR